MVISDAVRVLSEYVSLAEHLVAFTGAGISTPSGIPDFRSPTSGLWTNVDPMRVASIYGFRQDPQAFYDWVRPLTITTMNAVPNPAHLALVTLENHRKLRSIITQNIDMLHTRAGNQVVHELHGHMREATCIQCFRIFPGEPIIAQVIEDGKVPRCTACGGVLKPNVILFGEQLPYQQFQAAKDAARACDLMIVVGSSLEVAPASDLPILAKRTGAKLAIINTDPTDMDSLADIVIHGDAADILPAVVEHVEMKT